MTTVTLRNADRLQHVAVSRLQLYVTGRVHAILYPFQSWLVREVQDAADSDGNVDAGQLSLVLNAADARWHTAIATYTAMLTRARAAAGSIAFTPWRLKHNHFFPQGVERVQEAVTPSAEDVRRLVQMWQRRRDYALQVAQSRIYGDGLNLSGRIWRLERGGMQAIRNTVATAMAERTSAWELGKRLEGQLNAGQEWPQWSETRLRGMDARQRAQSAEGLWRNPAGRAAANADATAQGLSPQAGISYNALRLARNEIQAANHAVTSDIAQNFPGITGRNVVLSPAHPRSDQCDDAVAANPHPKGANFLPLHVSCLCRWEEVLMPRADFLKQTAAWVRGDGDFLDGYASWLGVRSLAPLPDTLDAAGALELLTMMKTWLDGDVDAMATVIGF